MVRAVEAEEVCRDAERKANGAAGPRKTTEVKKLQSKLNVDHAFS